MSGKADIRDATWSAAIADRADDAKSRRVYIFAIRKEQPPTQLTVTASPYHEHEVAFPDDSNNCTFRDHGFDFPMFRAFLLADG